MPSNPRSSPAGPGFSTPPPLTPWQQQNRLLAASLDERLKPEETVRQPPSPALAMILGVYTFPFTNGDVLLRLVGISLGLTFSFGMLVLALDQGVQVGTMALRPLGQAFGMSFILTMGYAVAQSAAIVQDTASGLEDVYNWPSFEWRDWALAYFFVVFVAVAAGMVAYGVYAATLFTQPWVVPLVLFVAFPIMLMSTLEGESPFMMFSLPVLRSLGSAWWAWILFYIETGCLMIGWTIAAVVGLFTAPYVTVPVTATLFALLVLVYARLLGRLAWCISQSMPDTEEE